MRFVQGLTQGMVGGGGIPFVLGATRANTAKILAGYTAMKAGTRNMIGAVQGSSVERGVDETAAPYGSQYRLSVAEQLAIILRNNGIASGANNWYGISGTNLNDYDTRDDRFTASGTAAMGSTIVQGGAGLSMSSATAAMSFTPQSQVNTADVYTMQFSGFNGGTLAVNADGGANTNIVQDATSTIRKTTIPLGAVGNHTVNIAWSVGSNALYGIECYDNTRKEISLRNWGISGGSLSLMTDNTNSPYAGRPNQMNLSPPDFVWGEGGMVNTWRGGVSVATAQTQFDAWVDSVTAAGADFIFVTPPFDTSAAGNTANQQQYVDMAIARTLAKGKIVLNLRQRWQSKTYSDARGWTVNTDAVHKTIAGQADTAAMLYPLLRWAMGS